MGWTIAMLGYESTLIRRIGFVIAIPGSVILVVFGLMQWVWAISGIGDKVKEHAMRKAGLHVEQKTPSKSPRSEFEVSMAARRARVCKAKAEGKLD